MNKRAVVCPNCHAKGKIDVERFKNTSFKLRCPKCGEHFEYTKERRGTERKIPLPTVRMGPYGFDFDIVDNIGVLMDISTTGIRVSTHSTPPKNHHRLNFRFYLPGIQDEIRVGGEVVWVRRSNQSGVCEFGVQFVTLDQYTRKNIGFFMFPDDEINVLEMELDRLP